MTEPVIPPKMPPKLRVCREVWETYGHKKPLKAAGTGSYGSSGEPLIFRYGAGDRNRTYDLRVTSALLYRLSYTGGDAGVN